MFGKTEFDLKQTDGYSYIHLVGSSDQPPLVFLHGMFGGLSNFDPLLGLLEDYTVFIPEIPVYDFDSNELDIPRLTEWLYGVLEDQGIRRPVLLGNSMGGHIALDYALAHPGMISGLVLTGSSGLFEDDLGSSKPRRYDRGYIRERAGMTFYDDLVDDTIVDEIMDVLQSSDKLRCLLKIARSTQEYNLEHQLHRIGHPVLLVWGRDDIITPPHVAVTFHNKLSDATLKWIDRCGHAPMMERPDEFAFYLIDFLNRVRVKAEKNSKHTHEEDYSHY